MKLNIKIIIVIVIAIIISWVGNIYIFNKYSLERPFLLKSYLNVLFTEDHDLQLSYISNIYDKDNICKVSFPEIGTQPFYINLISEQNLNSSNYRINKINIDLGTIFLEDGKRFVDISNPENISLKKIQLTTLSQETYEYDLGEIRFYKDQEIKDDNSIQQLSSMSSNNNSGNSIFQVNTDINITEIVNPLKDILLQVCDVGINDIPIKNLNLPLSFKSGDWIELKYQFNNRSEIIPKLKFSNFFIPLVFKGTDSNGNLVMTKVYIINDVYYDITTKDIRNMIIESR
jgi:hypothetical protein